MGPLPLSEEVSCKKRMKMILEGKCIAGPKQESVDEMKRYREGLNYFFLLLPIGWQGDRKIPMGIWLQISGCKCYWLYHCIKPEVGVSSRWSPRKSGGRNGSCLMTLVVCQLWNEIPVSHLSPSLSKWENWGLEKTHGLSKITLQGWKVSHTHPVAIQYPFRRQEHLLPCGYFLKC